MSEIKPWIVCAAIRTGELIIAGARHFDMIMQTQIGYYRAAEDNGGFIKWE